MLLFPGPGLAVDFGKQVKSVQAEVHGAAGWIQQLQRARVAQLVAREVEHRRPRVRRGPPQQRAEGTGVVEELPRELFKEKVAARPQDALDLGQGAAPVVGGETEVELKEEPQILDIVWHGWSQIKFVLSGEDGQPVPRCRVSYAPYGMDTESDNKESAYPHGFVVTQDDGSCNLTLPSGVYTFKFTPPQASSYAPRQIRQLSISADTTRKVSLDKKE